MTPIPTLIALKGHAASGKSTAKNWIVHNHKKATPLAFARPLKRMVYELIRDTMPKTWPHTATELMNNHDLKEQPLPFLANQSPRRLMQTLGTEWGRQALHENFWTDIAAARIESFLGASFHSKIDDTVLRLVFDDCRFVNEAEMIRRYGGLVVEITRPGTAPVGIIGHASEAQDFPADITISNDGTVEDLEAKLAVLFPPAAK